MPERVLKILSQSSGYTSGGRISSELGLTRAAVWKKISHLRKIGFKIEAVPHKGYRLLETPDLSEEELQSLCEGWHVVCLKKTGSTNDIAMAMAVKGIPDRGLLVIAEEQSCGKGRLGRTWASPPAGNIYMSVALRPEIYSKDSTLLTILSAVATAKVLRTHTGVDIGIKWPNDIVFDGKKLGGILLELRSDPDKISLAVIGIGLNINSKLKDLPKDLRHTATTLQAITHKEHKLTPLVAGIIKEIEACLSDLKKNGRGHLLNKWRALSHTLGKEVLARVGDKTLRGWAEDIDTEGRLLLRTANGALTAIASGDLTMLR